MFLFKVISTDQIMLHCGDFRACPAMEEYPSLWNNRIDKVYLDTTYCKPEYDFPNQADALSTAVEHIHNHLQIHPKTLIVCGTYTIGKKILVIICGFSKFLAPMHLYSNYPLDSYNYYLIDRKRTGFSCYSRGI